MSLTKEQACSELWTKYRKELLGIGTKDDDKIYVFVDELTDAPDLPETYGGYVVEKITTGLFKFLSDEPK